MAEREWQIVPWLAEHREGWREGNQEKHPLVQALLWGIELVICQSVSLHLVPTSSNLLLCEHTHLHLVFHQSPHILLIPLSSLVRHAHKCLLCSLYRCSLFPKAICVQALCPNRRPPSEATLHRLLSLSREDPPPNSGSLSTITPKWNSLHRILVCMCMCVFSVVIEPSGENGGGGGLASHSWRQMSVLPLSTHRLFTPSNTNTDTRAAQQQ